MLHYRTMGPLLVLTTLLLRPVPSPATERVISATTQPVTGVRCRCGCPEPWPATVAVDPAWAVEAVRSAFVRMDEAALATLLADDFVFRYRPDDVGPGEPDTADRASELDFARHLFRGGARSGAPAAERIELALPVVERMQRAGPDGRQWAKFLLMSHLVIHQPGGAELRVDSPVTFLVRRDPGREVPWRLVEWVELPGVARTLAACPDGRLPAAASAADTAATGVAVRHFTYALRAPVPNPFRRTTRVAFEIPERQRVRIVAYSVDGRVAATILDAVREPGPGSVEVSGSQMAAGVYFVHMQAGTYSFTQRIVLVR